MEPADNQQVVESVPKGGESHQSCSCSPPSGTEGESCLLSAGSIPFGHSTSGYSHSPPSGTAGCYLQNFSNLSLKTDLLLNSGAKIQKKSHSVKSLRAALRAAFRAASPNKPILTAKKRYVKFTQCFNQPQISLTSILNDAPFGFKQA